MSTVRKCDMCGNYYDYTGNVFEFISNGKGMRLMIRNVVLAKKEVEKSSFYTAFAEDICNICFISIMKDIIISGKN